MFPAFTDSRECKLLKKLLEAHEEQNSEAYTEAVKEFDSISRLDQWLTTMLLRIKKSIQGDGEGDGDLKWSADIFVACSSFLFILSSGRAVFVNKPATQFMYCFSSPCLCHVRIGGFYSVCGHDNQSTSCEYLSPHSFLRSTAKSFSRSFDIFRAHG